MIVWYGEWANRTPPGIYRVRYDCEIDKFVVELRKESTDDWVAEPQLSPPSMGEWFGITHLYDQLELLI